MALDSRFEQITEVSAETQAMGARPIFKAITALLLAVTVALLGWGLLHESSNPVVLGRYSPAYTALLVAFFAVAGILGYALWSPSPRLRSALGNLYLLLFSTVLMLAVVEAALRVFNPWGIELFHVLPYHMQGMVDHPVLGYVHPKSVTYPLGRNTVTLNSHGLRDREIAYDKPPGERRILVLGDSVTFGWGVDQGEPFSDRMEPRLDQLTGERWEVINAGVNGYNTVQELAYLQLEGMRYSPEIVILVYVPNDVDPVLEPNLTTWRRYPSWPSSLPELLSRIPALSFLYQSTNLLARMRPPSDESGARRSVVQHPRWPESRDAVVRIAELCAARGVKFLVARESADPAFHEEMARLGVATVTFAGAYEKVREAGQPTNVSRVDPHPSAAAHDAFAEQLVAELAARGWLGPTRAQESERGASGRADSSIVPRGPSG